MAIIHDMSMGTGSTNDPQSESNNTGESALSAIFTPQCHANVDEVVQDVDTWFIDNWNFPDQKSRKKFVAAGFSRVTCLYLPKALNPRIRAACKLLTILFLVDDQLEYMSLEAGKAYNDSLMPFCTGSALPDRDVPVQWMMYDIWAEMRNLDRDLAVAVEEPVFLFMGAQTSKEPLAINNLHRYLEYRQGDVGQALLAALMRLSYDLKLSQTEIDSVLDIEQNCGKHISLVNDIYSYEKEKLISEKESFEGAILCNAVDILVNQVSIPIEAVKSVLWIMVRECEFVHQSLMDRKNNIFPGLSMKDDLRRYVKGLEYQMSGNELWSKTTHRYRSFKAEFEQKQKMAPSSNLVPTKRSMDLDISETRSGDLSFQEEGSNMLHDRRYDSVISATV